MKTADDRLTLSVPSHPRYLCIIRAFLDSLLREFGFEPQEAHGVILAVHEACANVIEHGYQGDTTQRIDLTVHVVPERCTVEIRDYGRQQDIAAIKPRPLHKIRPGGLGTHFMQTLMDDVTYDSSDAGTLLRMTKRRSTPCKST